MFPPVQGGTPGLLPQLGSQLGPPCVETQTTKRYLVGASAAVKGKQEGKVLCHEEEIGLPPGPEVLTHVGRKAGTGG